MSYSRKLVSLIEHHADQLSHKCADLIGSHPSTASYHSQDPDLIYRRVFRVYSQLGTWISRETSKEDIARLYASLGARRREEGFELSEVVSALHMTRRVLWDHILDEGLLDSALNLHLALELYTLVVRFIDRAVLFAVIGYEHGQVENEEGLRAIAEPAL